VFDHVTIRVSDLEASRPFYETALGRLGFGEPATDGHFYEWHDFSISQASDERPVTRNLHAAFVARSREAVDEWWQAMTAAGYRDDGEPGLRPQYSPDYYGAFVLDPDGNSVEAVHQGRPRRGEDRVDHLWIRVRDLEASQRFYETVGPYGGFALGGEWPQARHFRSADRDRHFSVVHDDRPLSVNVHLAFPAADKATVEEFHRVALEAGYRDNGAPGERPEYHPGYYGAYVLDPDGNNIEAVFHDRRQGEN
jgi:catechol 2,3-dioxygenase-like lactoylglutathione lyase family enzyme